MSKEELCYVYFIQEEWSERAPVKIGVAKDVTKRINALSTANPRDLTVLFYLTCESVEAAFKCESAYHHRYWNRRVVSNTGKTEWFIPDDAMLEDFEFIKATIDRGDIVRVSDWANELSEYMDTSVKWILDNYVTHDDDVAVEGAVDDIKMVEAM